MKRILVAQADSSAATGGPKFPLAVGLVPWRGADPHLAIMVKAAFSIAGEDESPLAEILAEPEPFRLDTPSELRGAVEGELGYASDFVPRKQQCDVLLTGHAYAAKATTELEAAIGIGGFERRFLLGAADPTVEMALCGANLRSLDGREAEPVGPLGPVTREPKEAVVDDFDFARLQSAAPSQRMVPPAPDALIVLTGLSPAAGRRAIQLPAFVPRVVVEAGAWGDQVLDLRCDTLWIDTDFERLVLVWRAMRRLTFGDANEINRLVVSLEMAEAPRTHLQVLRSLPRGRFSYAVVEQDVRAGSVAVPDDDELEMARCEALEHGAEPTLSLEQYAQISAALAEQAEPRETVLERHVLDEHSWTLEERGWLERMGEAAMAGNGRPAAEFGTLFVAAQDALRGPNEPRSLEEFAEIHVELEQAEDPTKVLDQHGMRLAEWMRLGRHWQRRAEADDGVAEKLDRLVEQERARAATEGGASPDGDER